MDFTGRLLMRQPAQISWRRFSDLCTIRTEQHEQHKQQYCECRSRSRHRRYHTVRGTDLVNDQGYSVSKYVLEYKCEPEPLTTLHLFCMVEIAARHGESSRLNKRKLNPARAVGNHMPTACMQRYLHPRHHLQRLQVHPW